MTTKINPSEISSIIKKKIDGYKGAATEANVGEVLTCLLYTSDAADE